jgi:hypothetical protein
MKLIHLFLLGSLVVLTSCSRDASVPVFVENRSAAVVSNVVVVGLTHTNSALAKANWIPPALPQVAKYEAGTVLPNAAGGFSLRLDCEVDGKKLSHDTVHGLQTNITAKSVYFAVEPNFEVICGFVASKRVTPAKK